MTKILVANENSCTGVRTISTTLSYDGAVSKIELDVEGIYCDKLRHNILSLGKLLEKGYSVNKDITKLYFPNYSNEFIDVIH